MKKTYSVVNAQQFHLTFIPQRPKSCVERASTKKTHDSPASKENHEILRRCKSQQEISLSPTAETNKQRLSSHECLVLDQEKMSNGIRSQQILISSALRRPHASCYSLLDSQSTPEPAKPRLPSYRPKSACTVYSYAERPVSASEISRHLGRPTKASLLRSKSSYDIRPTTGESPRPSTDKKIGKKPCAVRKEYVLHQNSLTPKEVFDYMKSVHAYLTGARYNRSRLVDVKSVTKHGLYVSKNGLGSFTLDKAREMSPADNEHDLPKAALKVVESQTSQVDVINTGTNTEPYYLSLNKWHGAEWNQAKKHLPPHRNNQRRPISPNKVKPIKARYIDYNTI